jgi:hypothetical protein
VYVEPAPLKPAQSNEGLRILRSRADASALRLTLEGLSGRSYSLGVRTPPRLGDVSGVKQVGTGKHGTRLLVSFEGPRDSYVHRELVIPLLAK